MSNDKSTTTAKLPALVRSGAEYTNQFFNALRGAPLKLVLKSDSIDIEQRFGLLKAAINALTETTGDPAGEDGGFLVPEDFDNSVQYQKTQYIDLATLCTDIPVMTFKGWRALAAGPEEPLALIDSETGIENSEHGALVKISFQLAAYGGIIQVSSGLWADGPAGVTAYLAGWWARKLALTNTKLVIAKVETLVPTAVASPSGIYDALVLALNTTLDPGNSDRAVIVTNQTGYDMLDKIIDGEGDSYLRDDDTFLRRQVIRVADRFWANTTTTPIFVGDMAAFLAYFHRPITELVSTGESKEAWKNNYVEVRGILRADCEVVDPAAAVLLAVTA